MAYGYIDAVDDATGERRPSSRLTLEYAEAFEFTLKDARCLDGYAGLVLPHFRRAGGRRLLTSARAMGGADAFFVTCTMLAKYQIVAVREVIAIAP